MTGFWAGWVIFLVVFNLGTIFFLFVWAPDVAIPTDEDGTTGHSWSHGQIREGLHRLPMWWILFSLAMFVAGGAYLVRYPGFGNFKGVIGWTSHKEVTEDLEINRMRLAPLHDKILATSVEELASDPQVVGYADRLFVDNCSVCHGARAQGNPLLGAPDLFSEAWMYGGDPDTLIATITDGRQGTMPPLGEAMDAETITNLAHYVLSLSGAEHAADKAAAGEPSFMLCAACHSPDGTGNQILGAPNLTDSVWIYGDDVATIEAGIRDGRSGEMPAWGDRLPEYDIKALAAWVYAKSQGSAVTANAR